MREHSRVFSRGWNPRQENGERGEAEQQARRRHRGATAAAAAAALPSVTVSGRAGPPRVSNLPRVWRVRFRYRSDITCGPTRADWGLCETGASGPNGNPYGDAAGHTCVAVCGPDKFEVSRTLETGLDDREDNMRRFAIEALDLLHAALA